MSRAGSQSGTTLLEMLVVLAVTSLIAALVFPAIDRGLDAFMLHESATVVAADLRAARSEAIETGQTVSFVANPDGRRYGWTGGPVHVLPAGLSMQEPDAIYFYPDGTASPGAIRIRGSHSVVSLAVDSTFGSVRRT